jgi:hypothetical protein
LKTLGHLFVGGCAGGRSPTEMSAGIVTSRSASRTLWPVANLRGDYQFWFAGSSPGPFSLCAVLNIPIAPR